MATVESQVERIAALGIPMESSSLIHKYDPQDPEDKDVGPYPMWTFEDLMSVCRRAQIQEEVEKMGADDFMHLFTAYITEREHDMADAKEWRTYLDQLLSYIEGHPWLFDFKSLSYYSIWFKKPSPREKEYHRKIKEWCKTHLNQKGRESL